MVSNQVKLDISIVTYNSAKWLEKFIASLCKQNYPANLINIYIQDNSSTDNTLKLCQELKCQYADKFNHIEINDGKNLGFGYGHNQNLKRSTSDFFLVTNVDLEFENESINNVINTALNDPVNVASWEFRQKPYEHPKYYNPITLETTWSSSACILFRKSALVKVNGYDDKIFMYGEDVELSFRLRDHGYILKYCPKAVCWHYTYQEANELKPLQFFGSTLANVYIRLRYGSLRKMIGGYIRYLALFSVPIHVENRINGLWKNFLRLCKNTPHFIMTRKKSNCVFPIRGWDYEIIRDGAFYRYDENSTQDKPLVSIIMRTYKGRIEWLKQAIASVINQTYENIELLIVEDGSETAKTYVEEIQNKNLLSAIQYIPIPKAGRCVAGNAGLANAKGKYLCFLDDDDAFFAEHIEVLVNTLNKNKDVVAAYSIAYEIPTIVHSQDPLQYSEPYHFGFHKQPFSRVLLWTQNYIPIQSILFKRVLYEKHGGFDLDLEYLEDWNLWTRYSLDRDFIFIEKTTSIYRVPSCKNLTIERQKLLDSTYHKACEKQKHMVLSNKFTIADIMGYAKTINHNDNILVLKRATIKNLIKKMPLLKSSYATIRRIHHKLKKKTVA